MPWHNAQMFAICINERRLFTTTFCGSLWLHYIQLMFAIYEQALNPCNDFKTKYLKPVVLFLFQIYSLFFIWLTRGVFLSDVSCSERWRTTAYFFLYNTENYAIFSKGTKIRKNVAFLKTWHRCLQKIIIDLLFYFSFSFIEISIFQII